MVWIVVRRVCWFNRRPLTGASAIAAIVALGLTAGPRWATAERQDPSGQAAVLIPSTAQTPIYLPVGYDQQTGVGSAGSPGRAFLSSLILPGLGQFREGNRRWIAYAGVELVAAVLYVRRRQDAARLRTAYHDFAWTEARIGRSVGPRSDGDFDYYEAMSKWRRSGMWDVDPALSGVQPEHDPTTYNGAQWALAKQIYGLAGSPDKVGAGAYTRALAYYLERAYGPAYLWDWRGGVIDQEFFHDLIERSDGRFRDARRAVWILVSNHVLGALDGFVTARLRALPRDGGVEVGFSVPPWWLGTP